MFGGLILHFLLSNYLTVLLKPSYEEPVETAADLIRREITPFLQPGQDILIQFFAASLDPHHLEISQRFVIAKDFVEYEEMVRKVTSTGMYARIATVPWLIPGYNDYDDWYRSTDTISGKFQYTVHLSNKKWPLKKVLFYSYIEKLFPNFYF